MDPIAALRLQDDWGMTFGRDKPGRYGPASEGPLEGVAEDLPWTLSPSAPG